MLRKKGVSFWSYQEDDVADRTQTEEEFLEELNNNLKEKLSLKTDLAGVFIDSWSQTENHIDNEEEQIAFKRETEKLWNFVQNHDEFGFKTVADVIQENQELKAEIKWLNDVITKNISELQEKTHNLKVENVDQKIDIGLLQNQDFEIKNTIENFQNEVNQTFDGINQTLDGINQNLNHDLNVIDQKLDEIDQNISELKEKNHDIELENDDQNIELGALQNHNNEIDNQIVS